MRASGVRQRGERPSVLLMCAPRGALLRNSKRVDDVGMARHRAQRLLLPALCTVQFDSQTVLAVVCLVMGRRCSLP